jgi:hypothetical protein
MERRRFVARSGRRSGGQAALVQEAAWALASLGDDPAGLVTASRRILDRHPAAGALWWMASRILTSAEPAAEAHRVADALDGDRTGEQLAASLPDEATVCVVGWPEVAGDALARRRDLRVLIIDVEGELSYRGRRQEGVVPGSGLGAAAASADVVLIEPSAAGPDGVLAAAGSRAAAAVAHHAGVKVVVVAGVGRTLPAPLWRALVARVDASASDPWSRPDELVPRDLIDELIAPADTECPVAPELLRMTPRLGDAGPEY